MNEEPKRKQGRPPAAKDATGSPTKTSSWPRLSIRVDPKLKSTLTALSAETDQSIWQILATAVDAYVDSLKPKTRRAIAARVAEAARVPGEGN